MCKHMSGRGKKYPCLHTSAVHSPLRRHGPSGKLSGPTLKPLRGFFVSGPDAESSKGRLGAILRVVDVKSLFGMKAAVKFLTSASGSCSLTAWRRLECRPASSTAVFFIQPAAPANATLLQRKWESESLIFFKLVVADGMHCFCPQSINMSCYRFCRIGVS